MEAHNQMKMGNIEESESQSQYDQTAEGCSRAMEVYEQLEYQKIIAETLSIIEDSS